jgi:transposase
MKRKRRNHKPEFKAKVALAALKGDLTLVELSEKYDVHPNQITEWKRQLLSNAEQAFGGQKATEDAAGKIRELHAKIGQLTMENDFLEKGLERIHGPKGKGW